MSRYSWLLRTELSPQPRVELESQKVSETSLRNLFSPLTETGLRNPFLLLLRLVSETYFSISTETEAGTTEVVTE